ncbi:Ras GTPase [Cryptotrichosporon argae]
MQRPARPDDARELRIVVCGIGGVGKSALTVRFTTARFVDEGYNPTIEDSYRKQFVVDGRAVQLEILDTAGQEEYAAMAEQWYAYGRGFALVYSVTDRPTFDALPGLWAHICRVKDRERVPCVLISNKCDLGRLRRVSQAEGRALARSLGVPIVECSAADSVNVDVAFAELVRLCRRDEGAGVRHAPPPLDLSRRPPTSRGARCVVM